MYLGLLAALILIVGSVGALSDPALAQTTAFSLDTLASANLWGLRLANVAWGDYDNDGDLDILMSGRLSLGYSWMLTRVYRNDGGSFTDIGAGLPDVSDGTVAWGDYDNDGDLDILLTGMTPDSRLLSKIYRNDNGRFVDAHSGPMDIAFGSAAWGDYDNDGDLDLVLSGYSALGEVTRIYQNNAGIFADISAGLPGLYYPVLAWGDYDNDGDLDILMAGQVGFDGPALTIIFRNDNGGFTAIDAGLVGVSGKPSVAWGDYDNDSDLDILLAGDANPLGGPTMVTKVYRNDGGSFTDTNANLAGVGDWSSVAWGDYDNDGDLDILLAGSSPTSTPSPLTKIYRNDGAGFTNIEAGLPNIQYGAVAWGDYDNDGDLDILLAGSTSSDPIAQIYRNNLSTPNTPPTAPSDLSSSVSETTVTLNWASATDGQTPPAGLNYNLRVGRAPGAIDALSPMANRVTGYRRIPWLGNAQSGPSATLALPAGTYYWSVQTIDTAWAGSIFAPEQTFTITHSSTPPRGVTIAGPTTGQTGFTYAFTATVSPITSTQPITYAWSFGDGGTLLGSAATVTHAWATSGTLTITVAALNAGGVVVGMQSLAIASSFTDIQAGLMGVNSSSAAWGDYDNDGDLDILLAGYTTPDTQRVTKIYRNTGGHFTDIYASLPGYYDGTAAWGDYDNDGDLDILLTGIGPGLRTSQVYRNDGGNFVDANAGLPGINDGAAAWGDYDNDGDLDILLAGWLNSGGCITRIYRNDGGAFTDANAGLVNVAHSAVAWGDYDNDGDLDILVSGYLQSNARIYRNDGGTFTDINAGLLNLYHSAAAWGDYDNDGDLDVVLSGEQFGNYQDYTKIYRNDGGIFTDTNAGLAGIADNSVAWGDYDNDGDLDIVLSEKNAWNVITRIYRNDGGNFAAVDFGLPGVIGGTVAWGDYDNDGDLDLLLTGDGIAQIYRNDLLTTNTPPTAPTGLAAVSSGTTVTLNWAAATDGQTPPAGLNYNLRVGRAPGASNVRSPMANGVTGYRRIPWLGNVQQSLSTTLSLPVGVYYWSVQAIDTAWTGSIFMPEQFFVITDPSTPPGQVTIAGPATGQVDHTYAFTATVSPVTATQPITYVWLVDDHAPITYTGDRINSVTFNWTTTGIKTMTVTAANINGTITGTTLVTITAPSITGLSAGNSSPTTLGQPTWFTATATGNNIGYSWNYGDGALAVGNLISHTYATAGFYTTIVTAANGGNSFTTTLPVTITNLTPVAVAGSDRSVIVSSPVHLDGSGSYDPDGHMPLTYQWTQIGGPIVLFDGVTISQPTFTAPDTPGVLTFTLRVTDAYGLASALDTTVVRVNDRAITGLQALSDSPTTLSYPTWFTATAIGSNIVYTWNFGDGATVVGQVTSHTYLLSGTYTVVLTATNGGGSATASIPVTITNLTPLANAGPDQAGMVNTLIMLDGGASTDPDGHLPLSYEWRQTSGSPVVLSSRVIPWPNFTAPTTPSLLAFSLIVTDSLGLPSPIPDTVLITVSDQPLSALLAVNNSPTTLGQPTWFTATADGSNIGYTWDCGDGALMVGNSISHRYAAPGFYTAIITAANGANSLTATLPVTITNLAPVAVAGSDQAVIVSSQVDLDGSDSFDQDGHLPLAYQWRQVSGAPVVLSHQTLSQPTFTAPGSPTILVFGLTVTDSMGLQAPLTDTVVITVADQAIIGLQAQNNGPISVGTPAIFSTEILTGSNVHYQWDFGDGFITGPTVQASVIHMFATYGWFTATVTATNSSGLAVAVTPIQVNPYVTYLPLMLRGRG